MPRDEDRARLLEFFDRRPQALPVFERAVKQIRRRHPAATIRVQSTQIALDDPHGFAFFWLPPIVRAGADGEGLVLSFVLPYPLETPRIPHVTFVRHDRYTHHMPIDNQRVLDDEVLGWLEEAHALMRAMRHSKKV